MPVYMYKEEECTIIKEISIVQVTKRYRFHPNLILSRSLELFRAFFTNRCLRSSFALGLCKIRQEIRSMFVLAEYELKFKE
jgi:hypothetical protein